MLRAEKDMYVALDGVWAAEACEELTKVAHHVVQ